MIVRLIHHDYRQPSGVRAGDEDSKIEELRVHVVITGSNRGIGLALTSHYLACGDRVTALCRAPDEAVVLASLSNVYPGQLTVGAIDIGTDAAVALAAGRVDEPVDILINNAGIIGGDDQSFGGVDTDEWLYAFNILVIGAFRVTRAFEPHLRTATGKVAMISSHLGSSTWPLGGRYAYTSAKAAVNRMVQVLAIDLRQQGIAVVAVHPGHVQTDMGGSDAALAPEDSAAGIASVIDNLSRETSGCFLRWNGETQPW